MKVLMVEPGKTPYEAEIEGGLNSLQAAVGGIIQPVYPYEDPVALICNDEGKLMGLPLNRALYDEDGNIYDIVAGNFLIVGLGEENFATLPADLMEKYRQQFEHPEQFIRIAGKILAVKQPVPSLEEQEAQRAQMAAQEALQEEIRLEDSTDLAFDLDVFFRQYSGDYADLYPDSHEEKERMAKNAFLPESNQPVKIKPSLCGIRKMNLATGEVTKVIDTEFKTGHIQASRFTPGEIVFCNETGGDAYQRMWFCTADGSVFKPLYKETPLDWVTHETFVTKDYVYFNILGFQPRLRKQVSGIARINLRTDDVELVGQVELDKDRKAIEGQLTGRGFWHCNASRDNRWAAGDTFGGNVWLINVQTGQRHWLVSDTKMKPDHAHPSFSPDGTKVLFQSGHFTNGKRLNLMMVDITSFNN